MQVQTLVIPLDSSRRMKPEATGDERGEDYALSIGTCKRRHQLNTALHCRDGLGRTRLDRSADAPVKVDPIIRHWWARFLRMSASASAAAALQRLNIEIDIRHVLPSIRLPTLILSAPANSLVGGPCHRRQRACRNNDGTRQWGSQRVPR